MNAVKLSPTTLLEPDRQLFAARFSPRGDFLIGGGYDAHVHCWRLNKDEVTPMEPLSGHHGWVSALTYAPDGTRLFTADSWGTLKCWSLDEQVPVEIWTMADAHDGWIREVAVSANGTFIATCGRDRKVRIWLTEDGHLETVLPEHDTDLFTVAFHPHDEALVSGDLHGQIKQWNLSGGPSVRDFDAGELFKEHRLQEVGGVRLLRFSPDGNLLAAAGTRPKNGGNVQGVPVVMLFDWKKGQCQQTIELGSTSDVYVTDLSFHPDGYLLSTTSGNPGTGQTLLVNLDDGKPVVTEKKLANCHGLSLHPDGKRLAVTATNRGSNGNGRRLNKDGEYAGNWSPIQLFELVPHE